ncbi:DUF5686 family protein [Flavobacterium sp. RHBU_3]|uniref:DUF5686 family protein n=1 Tax=Flavobacterium sp. RHBU_3 TaxID=3391184 RepID=UPI003984D0DF
MKKKIAVLLFFISLATHAQITGTVTDKTGKVLPFVSISVQNTYTTTLANENGGYILPIAKKGKYRLVFRSIGYRIKEVAINATSIPYNFDVVMDTDNYHAASLPEERKNQIADSIINLAIQQRKANAEKVSAFEADFYSKGTLRVNNVPDKLLGQKIGNLGASIDTSGNGIIYLSETISKLKFKAPNNLYEEVIASRISGEDNGVSYNNADVAWFDFYQNYLPFEVNVISPLADNAPNYYRYSTEGIFYTENNDLIYKIQTSSKTDTAPTVDGFIYIVGTTGEIYATDLTLKGSTIKQPLLNTFTIHQVFGYNEQEKLWSKNGQIVLFDLSLLSVRAQGTMSYVYSNYNFAPEFGKKTFGPEIQKFDANSNAQTVDFWDNNRPIPLNNDEYNDYIQKGKLETLRNTTAYKDSIDVLRNRFKWTSIPLGYTYHNTNKNWDVTFIGLARRLAFNTVQAYWLGPGFEFKKSYNDNTYTTIGTDMNYGFAEQRFRATGHIEHKFNNFSKRTFRLSGGSSIEQFNPENPINKIVNSISTLFFRDNYMKLYDNNFLRLNYQEEIVNGVYLNSSFEYTRRHALYNNTDFSTLKNIYHPYTSNNPLLPWDYDTPAFMKHTMLKAMVMARINFGQTYRTRPDGRETISNPDYPQLWLKYEKGFNSTIKDYEYNHLAARVRYDLTLGNVGELGTAFRTGIFFNSGNVAFPDWRHFNGNETHVGPTERYLNVFNLLPYYSHSTNSRYFEAHAEHNFKGYFTNDIPFFHKLEYYLVVGAHYLATPEHNPYMEFTMGLDNLGWGKFRLLRFDYVRSYEGGFRGDGVIFGLTFIDFLE